MEGIYNGKQVHQNRIYDSLKNFIGENKVYPMDEILCVSTRNNDVYDMTIRADGEHSFLWLWRKKEQEAYTKAETADALDGLAGQDISIGADEVVNAMTADKPYYKNIVVSGAEVSQTITLKAQERIALDGVTISGEKGVTNGKITYAARELTLENIKAKDGATLYNAFEGYQKLDDENYKGLSTLIAENLDIDCPSLTHNIINVYTPADNAQIVIRNSKFNLTVDNSNVLRLANYMNAKNVTVVFENIDWTYENGVTKNDWRWAGLAIYQPASADLALNGDYSALKTWRFVVKNCRYNGELVTENNFGQHSQVVYMYNLNKDNAVTDPALVEGLAIEFK